MEKTELNNILADIWNFIRNQANTNNSGEKADDAFNNLFLKIFEFQFKHNVPYSKFSLKRGIAPDKINKWHEIAPISDLAFKEVNLCTFPVENAKKVFMTGGTTSKSKKGKIYISDTADEFIRFINTEVMQKYLFPDVDKIKLLMMVPEPAMVPHMYMAYGLKITMDYLGAEGSRFFITKSGFDLPGLLKELKAAEETNIPVAVLGPTGAAFGRLFEYCKANNLKFNLPPKSRIIDAGGMKGYPGDNITRAEFLKAVSCYFNIKEQSVINLLGMTEVTSLFPDNILFNYLAGINEPRYKVCYPWTRIMVIDPENFQPVEPGKTGLLCYYDMLNLTSVLAVQSNDLGYKTGSGFEIIGRNLGQEKQGCSMAISQILEMNES